MNNLRNFSIDELEQELALRKSVKESISVLPFSQIRYDDFIKEMESIMQDYMTSEDTDSVHYAFEAAMQLVYGKDIFEKLNKIR